MPSKQTPKSVQSNQHPDTQNTPMAFGQRKFLGLSMNYYYAIFFVVFSILRTAVHHTLGDHVLSTSAQQPLTIEFENALSQEEFEEFKKDIISNAYLHSEVLDKESTLSKENFSSTRGFVLAFNMEGLEDLKESKYNVNNRLLEFWYMARVPNANAFVLNLLICPDANASSEETKSYLQGRKTKPYPVDTTTHPSVTAREPGNAVGMHLDNTVQIDSWKSHVAHQVSAFYLTVPEAMQGGHLELWFHNRTDSFDRGSVPDKGLVPKMNMLVGFRGDAYHRVSSFTSPSHEPRVSLILESYWISPEEYSKTARFKVLSNEKYNSFQAKRQQLTLFAKILDGLYTTFCAVSTLFIAEKYFFSKSVKR